MKRHELPLIWNVPIEPDSLVEHSDFDPSSAMIESAQYIRIEAFVDIEKRYKSLSNKLKRIEACYYEVYRIVSE